MRWVTKTRLDHLHTLLHNINDETTQSEAKHILESIRRDIEENYAEIQKPIRVDMKK
jgi:hypothetical protein